MLTTRNQSKVSISGLTYNNLLEDTYNAIKDSEAFKNNFTSFTSNSAERLIVELYAYVATQIANRMDQMGNELFVDTASASGMSRLLKLVGAKIDFPAAASVDVKVSTSTTTEPLVLTTGIGSDSNAEDLNFVSGSFKSITANNGTAWEFINYKVGEDGEYVYDYTTPYDFSAPSGIYTVHEGTTRSLTYTINSTNADIITLNASPVIKNSVRIYYKQKTTEIGTDNAYKIAEIKKVENFFTTEALTAKTGIFTERNMGNGRCEITLKPYYDEGTQVSDLGKELLIMYRTGGGSAGNISIGAIDTTETFTVINSTNRATGYGQLRITNQTTGTGGKDELTTDEIRSTVLQEVRNTKIAITEEDYEYLLPKYDSSIELMKCYGEKDDESADLSETYGYYVNPLNVWLLIIKYNKEFYDAYLADTAGLTERINDISLSTLDINPRFDEKYQVNKANLNQVYKFSEFSNYFDVESYTYNFPINENGVELLADGGCQITTTYHPYIESSEPTRRGVNCFRRYDGTPDEITWASLASLASAAQGDVYRVTDLDPTGNYDDRWECIQSFSSAIPAASYADYWKQVDFSYVFDNLVPEEAGSDSDRMYVTQGGTGSETEFNPVLSRIDSAFRADWDDVTASQWASSGVLTVPAETYINVDGISIAIPSGTQFTSAASFCAYMNAFVGATTNMIVLKNNAATGDPTNVDLNPKEGYSLGNAEILLKQENDESATSVTIPITSSVTKYGALLDAINNALETAGLDDKYLAAFYQANGCYNLVLISSEPFTYQDKASSISGKTALYAYLLNNEELTWSLISEAVTIPGSYAESWGDEYLISSDGIFSYDPNTGLISVGFGEGLDQTTMTISCPNNISFNSFMNILFGLDKDADVNRVFKERNISVVYVKSDTNSSATLKIRMTSASDRLTGDIYINIFGGNTQGIILGRYYENIEKYLPDLSETVLDLLRRGPIKNLYSTSYITENGESAIDKYGSNYQLKFSTGLIGEQTFNQLSSGNSPAEVSILKEITDTMPAYSSGTYLYMKVDNINYDGGSITVNDITYNVPSENGYARFDLSWFNSATAGKFMEQLTEAFKTQGAEDKPLLKYIYNADNTCKIYTVSSAFYSSIDFGATGSGILYNLFGLLASVVTSPEGSIEAEQIKYKYYILTNSVAVGQQMTVKWKIGSTDSEHSKVVNIGYSLNELISTINNYTDVPFTINNGRLIFTELVTDSYISVEIGWTSELQYSSFKDMFSPETWEIFEENITGTTTSGNTFCKFENNGDYYIDLELDPDTKQCTYTFVPQNSLAFPYGDIYFHMYEDYSNDHIVSQTESGVVYTDEYNWNRLMTDRKVMLAEHVYKQPRFIPFDLAITVTLPNTEQYSQVDYRQGITDYLKTEYGPYSDNIGEAILPDDIIFNIKENFAKVLKVVVTYLGYNMANATTNVSSLETEFNQKHILASTESSIKLVTDQSTKLTSLKTIIVHGLDITLKYSAN